MNAEIYFMAIPASSSVLSKALGELKNTVKKGMDTDSLLKDKKGKTTSNYVRDDMGKSLAKGEIMLGELSRKLGMKS